MDAKKAWMNILDLIGKRGREVQSEKKDESGIFQRV
jgi:flagellar biosynthesis/type III secretory pathway ATPase